jgi:hypothetical protein
VLSIKNQEIKKEKEFGKMKNKQKNIHQLKADVLVAYLSLQVPGLTTEAKERWADKYEEARLELEKRIASELKITTKKDPLLCNIKE